MHVWQEKKRGGGLQFGGGGQSGYMKRVEVHTDQALEYTLDIAHWDTRPVKLIYCCKYPFIVRAHGSIE